MSRPGIVARGAGRKGKASAPATLASGPAVTSVPVAAAFSFLQGYVSAAGHDEWMRTITVEEVSHSKPTLLYAKSTRSRQNFRECSWLQRSTTTFLSV